MTYLLQLADKTTKRIPDDVGAQVVQSLAKQQGITINGAYYAHHMISACRPLRVWAEEQKENARRDGKYFCRYGHRHEARRLRLQGGGLCRVAGDRRPVPEARRAARRAADAAGDRARRDLCRDAPPNRRGQEHEARRAGGESREPAIRPVRRHRQRPPVGYLDRLRVRAWTLTTIVAPAWDPRKCPPRSSSPRVRRR